MGDEERAAGPSLVDSASPTPEPDAREIVVVFNGREFLRDAVRHPASWPLPGWLMFGVLLLARPELRWDGRAFDAGLLVLIASAVYWLAPLCVGYMAHTSFGMRPATDTELGCAAQLLRFMALAGLYAFLIMLMLV